MKFYLVDGEVKFLTHKVEYMQGNEQREINFYDVTKKDAYIAKLAEREITPTVTEYEQPSLELLAKCEGKTFKNYSEAKSFIEGNNIAMLKAELAETDYKIIKCYEYQLSGLELPYNIAELHAERQAIRDRINAIEGD